MDPHAANIMTVIDKRVKYGTFFSEIWANKKLFGEKYDTFTNT